MAEVDEELRAWRNVDQVDDSFEKIGEETGRSCDKVVAAMNRCAIRTCKIEYLLYDKEARVVACD